MQSLHPHAGIADDHESSLKSYRYDAAFLQVLFMCPVLFPTGKYHNSKYPFLGQVLHNKMLTCWINLKLQTLLLKLCPNAAAALD